MNVTSGRTQTFRVATTVSPRPDKTQRESGLAFWMERVLEECDRASDTFAPDPVHDLRVALRRCRSMADGLLALDPDKRWKQMKKAGRRLFRSLGELRDVHVMMEWVAKLGDPDDPVSHALQHYLLQREEQLKSQAAASLQNFDRKQWAKWSRTLPVRARRFHEGSVLFQHLALERWTAAHHLHRAALRTRSQVALHNLRIGIKRFRYIVENFLSEQHAAWKSDLKELQDLLGEVHDLDVLWTTAIRIKAFHDAGLRSRWHDKIVQERSHRVQQYESKMTGEQTRWTVWRSALPQGPEIRKIASQRLRLWASALDPDFKHSAHVATLSIQLLDGLAEFQKPWAEDASRRQLLEMSALLHDVGCSLREKNHHKQSYRLIHDLAAPLGWRSEELRLVAAIARYHRGALPRSGQKSMTGIPVPERQFVIRLSAVLRLANALDADHDGHIQRVRVARKDGYLIIHADRYSPRNSIAATVAGARHLLELVSRCPVLVKRMPAPKRRLILVKPPTSRS